MFFDDFKSFFGFNANSTDSVADPLVDLHASMDESYMDSIDTRYLAAAYSTTMKR